MVIVQMERYLERSGSSTARMVLNENAGVGRICRPGDTINNKL